jgi:phospholipid/cholesterol/gamma-HCH transport system substrate-binding protein
MLTRRIKIQLGIFLAVALTFGGIVAFNYVKVPSLMGFDRYDVTIELPNAAGLYPTGNVTYRGTEVGRVTDVRLNGRGGAEAVLSLNRGIPIPSDVDVQVHSVSAIGEQYVALLPRSDGSRPLRSGDVIPLDRTSVPPPINILLDAANRGIQAIPHNSVKTVVDESYIAFGGLGPELSRIVGASTRLASDARANLDPILALIDKSAPVLQSQSNSAGAIASWASHIADLGEQVRAQDSALAGLLQNGGQTADQARQLFDRLKPTLPVLLANLVSVGKVGVAYQPAIEQILVLEPQLVANLQGALLMNKDSKRRFAGLAVDFNLNLNLPPPCTTGFLPTHQQRTPDLVDTPEPVVGDLYCRIPQDSFNDIRGNRNYPCLTRPGKRAPTVQMCESDEEYVPLNDGMNWKGDPNATLSGQPIPQMPSGDPATPPALSSAGYDPATGQYVGPDGRTYTQTDLAPQPEGKSWQTMLLPPS